MTNKPSLMSTASRPNLSRVPSLDLGLDLRERAGPDGYLTGALGKKAPFSSGKNSVADAVLIELYATQLRQSGPHDV